jgi:1-acyl-sn-glycerol-3-phosphate acyltransferase
MTRPFNFEQAPNLPGADRVARVGLAGVRKIVDRLWDLDIEGLDNVPTSGPAIIAPNHLSFCDSVFIPAALPRRVWAIGKGEYLNDWKTKHLFPAMGMIPVDRSGGDAAQEALDTAARVLAGGHLFMIYPEGTRSRSGNLHKGRTGAARLAAKTSAPIIPVGHVGTLAIQPPDQFMMKIRLPLSIRFGPPIRMEDFGDPGDPRLARVVTDALMFEIAKLSGQNYVNTYAGSGDTPEQATPQKIAVPPGRTPTPIVGATGESIDLRQPERVLTD